MELNVEDPRRPANGAVYLQSNTHLFAFAGPTKMGTLKDEAQKVEIKLEK